MEINFVYTLKVYLLLFLHNARDSPCSWWAIVLIPGHLTVPEWLCPGRGTAPSHSETVPVVVTLWTCTYEFRCIIVTLSYFSNSWASCYTTRPANIGEWSSGSYPCPFSYLSPGLIPPCPSPHPPFFFPNRFSFLSSLAPIPFPSPAGQPVSISSIINILAAQGARGQIAVKYSSWNNR